MTTTTITATTITKSPRHDNARGNYDRGCGFSQKGSTCMSPGWGSAAHVASRLTPTAKSENMVAPKYAPWWPLHVHRRYGLGRHGNARHDSASHGPNY